MFRTRCIMQGVGQRLAWSGQQGLASALCTGRVRVIEKLRRRQQLTVEIEQRRILLAASRIALDLIDAPLRMNCDNDPNRIGRCDEYGRRHLFDVTLRFR